MSREIYNARYRDEINSGIDLVVTTRCRVKKERYEMSLWTMKEVIRRTGVTENALRYYNTKGVLPPTVQESSGRRQWLYDDSAIDRLKKLFLLKHIGVSIEDAGKALDDERIYMATVTETLEELKKKRDKLDQQIFIAQTLVTAYGVDLFTADDEMDEQTAAILNEAIREVILENAER